MNESTNLPPPLPITIAPGMRVVSLDDNPTGQIIGITHSFCVYLLNDTVAVDRWRNLALAGVCPASPFLPRTIADNDRLDASARLLREFTLLKSLGDLTPSQRAAMEELLSLLCPSLSSESRS